MGIKSALAGGFLRAWINKQLGKDWHQSWTVRGLLLVIVGATGAVEAVCGGGMMSDASCEQANRVIEAIGGVLIVLGLRRK